MHSEFTLDHKCKLKIHFFFHVAFYSFLDCVQSHNWHQASIHSKWNPLTIKPNLQGKNNDFVLTSFNSEPNIMIMMNNEQM